MGGDMSELFAARRTVTRETSRVSMAAERAERSGPPIVAATTRPSMPERPAPVAFAEPGVAAPAEEARARAAGLLADPVKRASRAIHGDVDALESLIDRFANPEPKAVSRASVANLGRAQRPVR
jgi:hypothetical protein